MRDTMHPSYFGVRFRIPAPVREWPPAFVILSGYATTGEVWPQERNEAADQALGQDLAGKGVWTCRITGFFPETAHAEPGWAAALDFDSGCDWGLRYLQDAIYVVTGDTLWVSHCDERRALVHVGAFRERFEETEGREVEPSKNTGA
jgi:hypothetical protein